jgi:hypothetical protein
MIFDAIIFYENSFLTVIYLIISWHFYIALGGIARNLMQQQYMAGHSRYWFKKANYFCGCIRQRVKSLLLFSQAQKPVFWPFCP